MTEPLIAIQIGPESLLDEGADHVLDVVRERAACNAVLISTHSFALGTIGRPRAAFHPGHGSAREGSHLDLAGATVPIHPEYYTFTRLQPRRPRDPEARDRDTLAEALGAARTRNLRVYARIAENAVHEKVVSVMPGYVHVQSIDHTGRRTNAPCLNHPDYRAWYLGIVEELTKTYPDMEGICIGMEGRGPLHEAMTRGTPGRCFCRHCREIARDRGVSAARAQEGFRALIAYSDAARDARPVDGYFAAFFRLLLSYPEILAWEQLYNDAKTSLRRELYGAIKSLDPTRQVGWHLWQTITFDPFLRAGESFDALPEYADWIKPAIYHICGGERLRRHLSELRGSVLGDLGEQQALDFYAGVMGHRDLPPWDRLDDGLPPGYVETETRRAVAAVRDAIPVYPGIDVDIPPRAGTRRTEPDEVYAGIRAAFAGGAKGIVISRKFSEQRLENLDAVGRAVREAGSARKP